MPFKLHIICWMDSFSGRAQKLRLESHSAWRFRRLEAHSWFAFTVDRLASLSRTIINFTTSRYLLWAMNRLNSCWWEAYALYTAARPEEIIDNNLYVVVRTMLKMIILSNEQNTIREHLRKPFIGALHWEMANECAQHRINDCHHLRCTIFDIYRTQNVPFGQNNTSRFPFIGKIHIKLNLYR